jgi:hypothetical protein
MLLVPVNYFICVRMSANSAVVLRSYYYISAATTIYRAQTSMYPASSYYNISSVVILLHI